MGIWQNDNLCRYAFEIGIIPFCSSASISTSVNNIKKLTNADVKEGKRFDGSATTAEIESWLKNY